jgi:hypothetical protein
MNCPEIQAQLSDFLDKSLDTIRSKSIENHLLSCVLCRGEAESMADCIRQVRDLPVVEPPLGFSQRVMAHARAIEVRPPFWQRFLFAGKFTMPIQASAVVLIAIFAGLLYQRENAIQRIDREDAPAASPATLPNSKKDSTAIIGAGQSRPTEPSSATKAKVENKRPIDLNRQVAAQAKSERVSNAAAFNDKIQPASPPAAAKPKSVIGDAGEAPRRGPIQAQEVATGREPVRPGEEVFGTGNAFGNLEQPAFRVPFSAERALSPLSEPASDVEFVVRRRPLERRDQRDTTAADALRKRAETDSPLSAAKLAAPQSSSSIVEIRWFTVPADRYGEFKKVLAAEATVESEKSLASAEKEIAIKSARDLVIKVMILSPAER